ncbi:MAG: rod shape-determining protein RodA [Flavobacteriaceae bacterium]|nr:rod shape-determining protein RodA [Flavobacteriaceae bacterium]
MRKRKSNIFAGIDPVLVLLFLALIFFGWVNIYAASITEGGTEIFDFSTLHGKQLQWIALSGVLILITISLDSKFYENFSGIIYIIALIALAGLFLFGNNINGATSWYNFGFSSIQPSEFAKAATALALANFLSTPTNDLKNFNTQLRAFIIVLLPTILIVLQPDAGSALIYLSLVFVLYREGLPAYYIGIGLLAILLFVLTLALGLKVSLIIVLTLITGFFLYLARTNNANLRRDWLKFLGTYLAIGLFIFSVNYVFNNVFEQRHRDRFAIVLGKTSDTQGIGYNTNQSMITIGSGGWTGKGFLEGDRTQGNFVPEQPTDYIFSTVGEEWGFLGSTAIILIFVAFIIRIIQLAERQKSDFSRIFGYATATIFFFHFMINIGMVIGLIPTIGIPLPFFSYGGSSLWGFTLLLFIFIRLDADRTYVW